MHHTMPIKLQDKPLEAEKTEIKGICRDYIDSVLSENLSKHIIGFIYHRKHNYYMKFAPDSVLEETVFFQPRPPGKLLFGNRVVDMLTGGM